MKTLLFVLLSLSLQAFAESESFEFDIKGLNDVEIESTSGKINLVSTEESKATVVATKIKFSEKCQMSVDKNGDTLVIKVDKKRTLSLEECSVDFEIKLPKQVDLEIALGTGQLSIQGITGDLEYALGSGNLTADGTFEKIDGKTGSGNVSVKGLIGGGDIKMGTGKLDLTFATLALKGEIDLKTGTGDATLMFPKGTKLKTDFRAGTGDLTNEIGDNPEAEFKVTMRSGTGDLSIKTWP